MKKIRSYTSIWSDEKYQVHDSFRQLIAQNSDGKIHALQLNTESSIRATQERFKKSDRRIKRCSLSKDR